MSLRRAFVLAACACACAPSVAQESAPATRPAQQRRLESLSFGILRIDAGSDGRTVLKLAEEVTIQAGDLFVRADNAVVWLDDAAREATADDFRRRIEGEAGAASRPTPPGAFFTVPEEARGYVREIYADGIVLVLQGDEVTRADAVYFDFERDRGIVVDARTSFAFPSREGTSRLHIRAEELRLLALDRFEAVGVRASTCAFGHPHYHVSSDTMEIWRSRAAPRKKLKRGEAPFGVESRPTGATGLRYTASGNALNVGSAPVFWFPDLAGEGGSAGSGATRYLRDVRVGSSSEFGLHGGATVGGDLVDELGDPWAEWGVLLDYRSKRGLGGGVDFAYDREDSFGYFHGYYQRDHGVDRRFGPPEDDDRGRVSFQHRQKLPWELQLDLEANYFSDEGFYPTYYEIEEKTEKPPETYAYLKRTFDRSALTALFSTRVDSFESATEYRPKVDYTLLYEPLFEIDDRPVYFSTRAEAAQVRRREAEALGIPDRSTTRVDVEQLVEAPFDFGAVTATPFAGLRATYYGEDVFRRDDRLRDGFTYGVELTSQLHRAFDAEGGLFRLDGLRHVVRPSIEYRRTTGVDLAPAELVAYDDVDAFGDREEVVFGLRNLFQTVRKRQDGPQVDEFLDLDFELSYFPDAARDNGGDPWGPLRGDHVVRFSDRLQLLADFEVRLDDGGFETWNVAAGYAPSPELQTYAGVRNYDEVYGLLFGQVNWRVTEKWLVRAYGSYDYERGKSSDYELGFVRVGHDFVFEVYVNFDFGEDDRSVRVALTPRAWFNPVVDPARRLGGEPRLRNLDGALYR
jgi:hypothetical protein